MRRMFAITALGLISAQAMAAPPPVLDTRWTKAAAAASATDKSGHTLPQFRAYDAKQRLIFRTYGGKPAEFRAALDKAVRADRPIAGPTLKDTMAALETRDGRPATGQLKPAALTVIDYWADWCAPCKVLGKELEAWAATRPAGSVQIVRAETDLLAAARARGDKIHFKKLDKNGKVLEDKTETVQDHADAVQRGK